MSAAKSTAWRDDLPLRGGSSGRFVVSLIAVLVFVAALAVTVNAYIGGLLDNWSRNVSGTLTVQLPAANAAVAGADPDALTRQALEALNSHPAVAAAAALPRDKTVALLEPWLGSGGAVNDLPLPVLIDVTLRDDGREAVAAIAAAVKAAVPAAVVDDHRVWLGRVMGLAEGLGAIAWTVTALVAASLGLTVVFATRASLTEFAQVIEVLHLIGAKDGYVARQFARRALRQGFSGGLLGLALYAPVLALVAWLAGRIDPNVLPAVSLPLFHWAVVAALPFAAGLVAMVTAHITVRHNLATMI